MSDSTAGDRDAIDHEENCAACGVNDRVEGTRHCEGCHEALIADGGVEATEVSRDLLYIHGEENDGRNVQVTETDGEVFIGVTNGEELQHVKLEPHEVDQVKEALDDV